MAPGSLKFAAVWQLLLPLVAFSPAAFADQLSGPNVGVTPYGMGRAYSAITDDWLALHYNPAGLAQVSRIEVQPFDVKLESNHDVVSSRNDLKGLSNNSGASLASSISKFAGKHIMAEVQDVTQVTVPGLAFAMKYDNTVDFDLENLSYPVTHLEYVKDLTLMAGGGVAVGSHKELRVGATLKYVMRTGGERDIPIAQVMGSKSTTTGLFSESGSGIGGDVGMQYRLPVPGRIEYTSSFVWHDIGKTSFGGASAVNPPSRIDQDVVAGLAVRFPIGGMPNRRILRRYGAPRAANSFSFVFDYDHANKSWQQQPLVKHLHYGVNLDLPVLSFQLGMNQTALTFGSSFDIGIVKVGIATYGEELGSYAGQRVDRRYLLSVGSVFGFGAGSQR
jgi:hypothetical protein